MLILAFDATGGACAAALVRDGVVIASRSEVMDKGHAERLFPLLREMTGEHSLSDIDAVAVCTGPGNFTGARIGVAAARGLALSLGVRSIGVDRFECAGVANGCVVLPARGTSVHAARFKDGALITAATIDRTEIAAFAEGDEISESDASADLAALALIAEARLANPDAPRPAPRYLRPGNAALPKNAPPPLIS